MSEYDDKIKKQSQSKFEELLQGPFENICMSALNDFIEAQVTFGERAGLSAQIIRYPIGKCCEWCEQLAGTYDAADAPPEIYARHDNCTCIVLYKSEKTGKYTDVWSKKEFNSEREARIAREHELSSLSSNSETTNSKRQLFAKAEDEIKFPTNPLTGEKYKNHNIHISDKQFGKKVGKHAQDFGLDPSQPEARDNMMAKINYISKNADERYYGKWRGYNDLVIFHIKDNDVVIESATGQFITILKGGINNERVKNARKRKV